MDELSLLEYAPGHAVYSHRYSAGSIITVRENFAGQISASIVEYGRAGYGEWHLIRDPETNTHYLECEWFEMSGADLDSPTVLEEIIKDCVFNYLATKIGRQIDVRTRP